MALVSRLSHSSEDNLLSCMDQSPFLELKYIRLNETHNYMCYYIIKYSTMIAITICMLLLKEFTYPKFMTQNDRDFQKVLQALTAFDKKLSTLEDVVKNYRRSYT